MKKLSILIAAALLTGSPLLLAAPPEGTMAERGGMMGMREGMTEKRAEMMQARSEAMSQQGEKHEEHARDPGAMEEGSRMNAEQADAKKEAQGMFRGEVARAVFTTSVVDREPVDTVDKLSADRRKIYFFTELRGMAGQTVTHRWEHDGRIQAEVKFNVKGPRWRVWSSKNLPPDAIGKWTVSVINGNGKVIFEKGVNITPPEAVDLDTTGTVTQPTP